MLNAGTADIAECEKNIEEHVRKLCAKAASSSVPVQHLQKRLILFKMYMEEAAHAQQAGSSVKKEEESKTFAEYGFNKDDLDKSNAKRKKLVNRKTVFFEYFYDQTVQIYIKGF